MTINVDIWNGIIVTSKTYGPFTMEIPQLNRIDMYKFMVYTLLKNNFTLLSAEEIKSIGCPAFSKPAGRRLNGPPPLKIWPTLCRRIIYYFYC